MRLVLLSLVLVSLFSCPVFSQQVCDDISCEVVQSSAPQVTQLSTQQFDALLRHVETAQSTGPSSQAAVRVTVGNGCGSGSVCGLYRDGCLVLTNAHVAGTRPGSRSRIRAVVSGQDREFNGVLLQAAYSDRYLTDWAILYVEGLKDIRPVRLSTKKPDREMYTKGSPRCVWPLRDSALVVADIADDSTLVRWRPNSIGGQSGSGCWDVDDDLQRAILTWSWGGLGAGQQTAEIYRQSQAQTVKGALRTGSEIEVGRPTGVVCENGFFFSADLNDFDIWDNGDTDPDPDLDPNAIVISPEDLKTLKNSIDAIGGVLSRLK